VWQARMLQLMCALQLPLPNSVRCLPVASACRYPGAAYTCNQPTHSHQCSCLPQGVPCPVQECQV
jgi:hypothetical protein